MKVDLVLPEKTVSLDWLDALVPRQGELFDYESILYKVESVHWYLDLPQRVVILGTMVRDENWQESRKRWASGSLPTDSNNSLLHLGGRRDARGSVSS